MKNIYILLFALFVVVSCKTEKKEKVDVVPEKKSKEKVEKNEIATYNYESLKPLLEKNDDKTYVVNFWATWCAPCIKEMPYFEQIIEENADKKIKLVFVSMDFLKDLEDRVVPFVREKGIIAECVLLDEKELTMTEWINRLSKDWEGEIPATLMIKGSAGIKEFYAREFTFNQLQAIVTPLVI